MGEDVYNDRNKKAGEVKGLTIAPDKAVSWPIIGMGGILAMGEHEVAIRAKMRSGQRFKLPSAPFVRVFSSPRHCVIFAKRRLR